MNPEDYLVTDSQVSAGIDDSDIVLFVNKEGRGGYLEARLFKHNPRWPRYEHSRLAIVHARGDEGPMVVVPSDGFAIDNDGWFRSLVSANTHLDIEIKR